MAIPPRAPTAEELAWYHKQKQREADERQAFKNRIVNDPKEDLRQYFPNLDKRVQDLAIDELAERMVKERVAHVHLLERPKAEINTSRSNAQYFDQEQRENEEGPYAPEPKMPSQAEDRGGHGPRTTGDPAQVPNPGSGLRDQSGQESELVEKDAERLFDPNFPGYDKMTDDDREYWREKLGSRLAASHDAEVKKYYKGHGEGSREQISARHAAEWELFEEQFGTGESRPITEQEIAQLEATLKVEALTELEKELRDELSVVISARIDAARNGAGDHQPAQGDFKNNSPHSTQIGNEELFQKLDEVFQTGSARRGQPEDRGVAEPSSVFNYAREPGEGREDPVEARQPRRRAEGYDQLKAEHTAAADRKRSINDGRDREQIDRKDNAREQDDQGRRKLSFFEDRVREQPDRDAASMEQGEGGRKKLGFFEDRRSPGDGSIPR